MCGIAGLMRLDGGAVDPALLRRMLDALGHRGPDGEGMHFSGSVGLGQKRLSIIDLEGGRQPLLADDGTALVGNGEIYNYRELYAELPDEHFKTGSDCELPLHLYRRRGLSFTEALRGMYALAIHDPKSDSLILSRDPFGIKPIYYAEASGHLLFASEPRALFASGLVAPKLIERKRDELVQLQFTTGSATVFAGIERLMPGETLVALGGRIARRERRIALPSRPAPTDEAAALKELDRLLLETVDLHQRADVPYGLFLSGGIDSSVLLTVMARLNPRPVRCFSIGFPGSDLKDERHLAERLARKTGAEFRSVDFGQEDFWRELPNMARAMDDPAGDYACLPSLKLAAFAAREVKVVLSGEGGDEIFAGYGRYRAYARPFWQMPKMMRRAGALDGLKLFRRSPRGWRAGFAAAEAEAERPGESRLQRAQRIDIADWLPNDLLTKLDRCLMQHGLEGRTPFLDPALSPFGFGLPDGLKVADGRGKYLLRRWLAQNLPEAEPFSAKRGFTVPVGPWIAVQGRRLAPLLAKQPGIAEAFDPERVAELIAAGADKHPFAAWALLFFALWHQHHILGLRAEGGDAFALLEAR